MNLSVLLVNWLNQVLRAYLLSLGRSWSTHITSSVGVSHSRVHHRLLLRLLWLVELCLASPSLALWLRSRWLEASNRRISVDCLHQLLHKRGEVMSVAVPCLQVGSLHHVLLVSQVINASNHIWRSLLVKVDHRCCHGEVSWNDYFKREL